jgi:hypothetical protein
MAAVVGIVALGALSPARAGSAPRGLRKWALAGAKKWEARIKTAAHETERLKRETDQRIAQNRIDLPAALKEHEAAQTALDHAWQTYQTEVDFTGHPLMENYNEWQAAERHAFGRAQKVRRLESEIDYPPNYAGLLTAQRKSLARAQRWVARLEPSRR